MKKLFLSFLMIACLYVQGQAQCRVACLEGNTFLGTETGPNNPGINNTFIGSLAGFNNLTGTGNIFLGYQAGFDELGSNKLYIANSPGNNPLIYGDFELGRVGINTNNPLHDLHVTDDDNTVTLFLQPQVWNKEADVARILFGDRFHFIRANFGQGLTIGDFDGIFFNTGGNRPQTQMLINAEGNVGVGSTEPTAKLHVKGDVRLEGLPDNPDLVRSNFLLIDDEGNIKRGAGSSFLRIIEENEALKNTVEILENRLEAVEARIGNLIKPGNLLKAQLFQNVPNPADQDTEIKCFLPENTQEATLIIYNWQGQPIQKMSIEDRGEAILQLPAGSLPAGIYHYTLVADGQKTDIKEMIIL